MKKPRLDQRRGVSPDATPHSATAQTLQTAISFTENVDVAGLIDHKAAAQFLEQVLLTDTVYIQTKADGDPSQYIDLPYKGKLKILSRKGFSLQLQSGRIVCGPMTHARSYKVEDLRQGRCTLLQYINQARGSVFYAVNKVEAGRHRSDRHICAIRGVVLDLDGQPLPSSFPLPPTALVATSPGRYQVIWRVEGVAVEEYKTLQQNLADRYGGDRAVCNPSLVLRLPGTLHYKTETPYVVKVLTSTDVTYTREDILVGLLGQPAEVEIQPRRPEKAAPTHSSKARRAAAALEREAQKLATTPPGNRNRQLYASAAALGNLVGGGVLDESVVIHWLREAAQTCGLTEPGVSRTLHNGIERGKTTPRSFRGRAQ